MPNVAIESIIRDTLLRFQGEPGTILTLRAAQEAVEAALKEQNVLDTCVLTLTAANTFQVMVHATGEEALRFEVDPHLA